VYRLRNRNALPGTMSFHGESPVVVNLYAKLYPGPPPDKLKDDTNAHRLQYFSSALSEFAERLRLREVHRRRAGTSVEGQVITVAFPYCIGGGFQDGGPRWNWEHYARALIHWLHDVNKDEHMQVRMLVVQSGRAPVSRDDLGIDDDDDTEVHASSAKATQAVKPATHHEQWVALPNNPPRGRRKQRAAPMRIRANPRRQLAVQSTSKRNTPASGIVDHDAIDLTNRPETKDSKTSEVTNMNEDVSDQEFIC